MFSHPWRPVLAFAIVAIGAAALLAPNRIETSSLAPHNATPVKAASQTGDQRMIVPADAQRDLTNWRFVTGDQSAD
jgi:hypothetical protein